MRQSKHVKSGARYQNSNRNRVRELEESVAHTPKIHVLWRVPHEIDIY